MIKYALGAVAALIAVLLVGGLVIDVVEHSISFLFHEVLGVGVGLALGGGYVRIKHRRAIATESRRALG
jgi:NhaP-type Na+/H+ or K+/H+ antiporter